MGNATGKLNEALQVAGALGTSLEPPALLLDLRTTRHVAHGGDGDDTLGAATGPQLHVGEKLAAVLAHTDDVEPGAQGSIARNLLVPLAFPLVRRAEALGDECLDGHPHHLLAFVPEHFGRARVDDLDPTIGADDHQAVGHRLEEPIQNPVLRRQLETTRCGRLVHSGPSQLSLPLARPVPARCAPTRPSALPARHFASGLGSVPVGHTACNALSLSDRGRPATGVRTGVGSATPSPGEDSCRSIESCNDPS